jgi:hypothetical protein
MLLRENQLGPILPSKDIPLRAVGTGRFVGSKETAKEKEGGLSISLHDQHVIVTSPQGYRVRVQSSRSAKNRCERVGDQLQLDRGFVQCGKAFQLECNFSELQGV